MASGNIMSMERKEGKAPGGLVTHWTRGSEEDLGGEAPVMAVFLPWLHFLCVTLKWEIQERRGWGQEEGLHLHSLLRLRGSVRMEWGTAACTQESTAPG